MPMTGHFPCFCIYVIYWHTCSVLKYFWVRLKYSQLSWTTLILINSINNLIWHLFFLIRIIFHFPDFFIPTLDIFIALLSNCWLNVFNSLNIKLFGLNLMDTCSTFFAIGKGWLMVWTIRIINCGRTLLDHFVHINGNIFFRSDIWVSLCFKDGLEIVFVLEVSKLTCSRHRWGNELGLIQVLETGEDINRFHKERIRLLFGLFFFFFCLFNEFTVNYGSRKNCLNLWFDIYFGGQMKTRFLLFQTCILITGCTVLSIMLWLWSIILIIVKNFRPLLNYSRHFALVVLAGCRSFE